MALSDEINWGKMRDAMPDLTRNHCNGVHYCEVHVRVSRGSPAAVFECRDRSHWQPVELFALNRADLHALGLLK
jgi:hypothetical protein